MFIRNCKFVLYLSLTYRWASFLRKFKKRFFFSRTNVTTPIPIAPPPNNVSKLTWIYTTCIISTQFTDFLAKCIYLFFREYPSYDKLESPSFINALYQVWLNWPSGSGKMEMYNIHDNNNLTATTTTTENGHASIRRAILIFMSKLDVNETCVYVLI